MSGAFLSPQSPSARERQAEREEWEYRESIAQSSYRWATRLMLAGMGVIAVPQLGLQQWNWHIVVGMALVMTVLAVQMMRYGRVWNGLACLVCAFAVLPGWVFIAQDVIAVAIQMYQMIAAQWQEKFS